MMGSVGSNPFPQDDDHPLISEIKSKKQKKGKHGVEPKIQPSDITGLHTWLPPPFKTAERQCG